MILPTRWNRSRGLIKGVGIKEWQKLGNNKSGAFKSVRDEISRAIKPGGVVISFGWNSVGMSPVRNFEKIEILLVCHGGNHRDTICVVERKIN